MFTLLYKDLSTELSVYVYVIRRALLLESGNYNTAVKKQLLKFQAK